MKKKTILALILCYIATISIVLFLQIYDLGFIYRLPTPSILSIRVLLNLFLLIPVVIALCANKTNLCEIGFSKQNVLRQVFTGIAIGLGMGLAFTLMPCLLGLKDMVYQGTVYRDPWYAAYELLYFMISVGLVEEIIFRGYFYEALKNICASDHIPIIITSLLFGFLHIFSGNILQVFTTALIGAFFCWCKEHIPNCTLLSLAIAHGLHDWLIRAITSLFN